MKKTTYFNLKKPDETDFYKISDHNENSDIIDGVLREHAEKISKFKPAYPITKTTESTVTLKPNTITWISGKPSTVKCTLDTPDAEVESEYRVTFYGAANQNVSFTVPTGKTLAMQNVPKYQEGYIYEFSFVNVSDTVISGTYREIKL